MQAAPTALGFELSSTRPLPAVKAPSLMPSDQPPSAQDQRENTPERSATSSARFGDSLKAAISLGLLMALSDAQYMLALKTQQALQRRINSVAIGGKPDTSRTSRIWR